MDGRSRFLAPFFAIDESVRRGGGKHCDSSGGDGENHPLLSN
ncbi:hypothetical protein ABIC86_001161 [Paenibacillus sp. DS2363]